MALASYVFAIRLAITCLGLIPIVTNAVNTLRSFHAPLRRRRQLASGDMMSGCDFRHG